MSFRFLSFFIDPATLTPVAFPKIDFRRAGRILWLGVVAEQENRSWRGPKAEGGLVFVQQSPALPFFS
jgi:hypothetical protein